MTMKPELTARRRGCNRSKLRALSRRERVAVKRWLLREKFSYAETQRLLREQFGISLSIGTLSKFWHRFCVPLSPQKTGQPNPVLLDVILQSRRPIRVRILQNNARLSFKVGRQRRRSMDKKPDYTIGPAAGRRPKA